MTAPAPTNASAVERAVAARIAPVSLALVAGYAIALAALWATSHGGLDAAGRPLGTDFSNVWAAGRLTLEGAPAASYDMARHYAVQVREFGAGVPFYGWCYPPMFLAIAAALATLPYVGALVVWQAATLPLYLFSVTRILGTHRREVLLAGLAFPAVFVNLTHGHNGFLTASLFGLGLAGLRSRPILAGFAFGLLAYKPQFGVLLPFALMAGGYWRAAISAAVTVAAISAVSLAAFGPETWVAFSEASATWTRTLVLEAGDTGWHKIMSVFSAARALGADVTTAYVLQALVALATIALTVRLWWSDATFGAKAAALLAGSVLVTPYAMDYDLMLFAPAIAFLVRDALADGFRRGEAVTLAAVWLAPLIARPIAEATLIPVGFIAVTALFALAVRRGGALTLPARTHVYAAASR